MRHGESTWNAAGRMQGQDPRPPLTERGRHQVAATATLLAGGLLEAHPEVRVSAIVTSPARRARQSADIVADRLGLQVREEPLLLERGLDEPWESVEQRIRAVVTADLSPGTLLMTHGDVVAYAAHLLAEVSVPVPANASVIGLTPRPTPASWQLDALC